MDMASTVVVSDNPKDMEAAISQILRQIDEIREQMKADDAAIAKIRAESAILSAETRAMRMRRKSFSRACESKATFNMRYYRLEPEVPGQMDSNTRLEPSSEDNYLPLVERLHIRIEGWLGNDLMEVFPCYFITDALKKALEVVPLSGFEVAKMEVSVDEQLQMFPQMAASWPLPQFHWLKITGSAAHEDFGITPSTAPISLVVSERALSLLHSFNIRDCDVAEFNKPTN